LYATSFGCATDHSPGSAHHVVLEFHRNANGATISWRFTVADARNDLERLYAS
jgi:hypothetical protein